MFAVLYQRAKVIACFNFPVTFLLSARKRRLKTRKVWAPLSGPHMQYYCCRVDLSSHETRCCCRGANVIAAESYGVTKLRWVRAVLRSPCRLPKNTEYTDGPMPLFRAATRGKDGITKPLIVNSPPQEYRKRARKVATAEIYIGRSRRYGSSSFRPRAVKRIIKHWKPRRLPASRLLCL